MELEVIPRSDERWAATARIVSSRFPTVGLFDRVADPADLEAAYYIESLTNPRLREEVGEISMVAPEERISGPGTTPIMAAFTHINPFGSRFSEGTYGVYYCARTMATAIRETVHHRERFMRYSNEKAVTLEMRVYYSDILTTLHDIRAFRRTMPEWYAPDDYRAPRQLGAALRSEGSFGIVYHSVRDNEGECAAILRPRALSPARQGEHLGYQWDGNRIANVTKLELSF